MRYLVTGCAGFIGSHLVELLISQGHMVIGIDNFDPFYDRKVKERNMSRFMRHANFTFYEFDISIQTDWKQLNERIDVVVHLAAKAGVGPSIENSASYFQTNVFGTQCLLDWMKKNNVSSLLFASSSSVYGNNEKTPFEETDRVDFPISPYASSKKASELLIYTYCHLFKMKAICMRFFTVYGPRQRPDLAIHKFFKLIKNDQKITVYGDGSSSRDYTYVADTVAGIIKCDKHLERVPSGYYDIFNLGNNEPVKLINLVHDIFEISNKKINIEHIAMQKGDVEITYADIEKSKRVLGYHPTTSVKEGLVKFYDWYKEQS